MDPIYTPEMARVARLSRSTRPGRQKRFGTVKTAVVLSLASVVTIIVIILIIDYLIHRRVSRESREEDKLEPPPRGSSCDLENETHLDNRADLDLEPMEGGKISIKNLWPWAVFLSGGGKYCGGTLINHEWVLTAAHCRLTGAEYSIMMGFVSWAKDEKTTRRSAAMIPHKGFQAEIPMSNDIMLIKLDEPVDFTIGLRPICLPEKNANFDKSDYCFVTGWGTQRKPLGKMSDNLKYLRLDIVDFRSCKEKYHMNVFHTNVCAIVANAKVYSVFSGPCVGDSGSPLSCRVNGKWFVAGIVSYGVACSVPHLSHPYPAVFTRVSHYSDWIEKTMEKN